MGRQFIASFKAFGTAFRLVSSHNLWWYFTFPVIIFILLMIGGAALIDDLTHFLRLKVLSLLHSGTSTEDQLLTGLLSATLTIGLKILFFFLYSIILKYLILILLSPVLSLLSEKTEELITGKKYSFNIQLLLKNTLRGVLIAIRNMFIQTGLLLLCFAITMIPVIGWLAPFLLLLVNYYFYGFSMMDYSSERYGLNMNDSLKFVRKNKGLAIGNGMIFSLLFAIPFLGVVIAPIISVIAATVVSVEALQLNSFSNAKN